MTVRSTKIHVALDQDDTGWPPVEGEWLWGEEVGPDRYRIVNIPLFAPGLAWGDEVTVSRGAMGMLELTRVVARSGHSTFWVVPLPNAFGVADLAGVASAFAALGIHGEGSQEYSIVAFDVPPTADVAAVRALAEQGNRQGRWEAVIGFAAPAWERAGTTEQR